MVGVAKLDIFFDTANGETLDLAHKRDYHLIVKILAE